MSSLQKRSKERMEKFNEKFATHQTTNFSLPCNDESNAPSYREGTEAGNKLERRMTEVKRMKEDVAQGIETTSSNDYTVPVDGKFNLSKYCEAEEMTNAEYKYLSKRLTGKRKQPNALLTTSTAVKDRRYLNNKNFAKNAAKKVVRKTGF